MEIGEIIKDALVYPFNNIVSLLLYMVLGIIACVVAGGTIVSIILGQNYNNLIAIIGSGIIGTVVFLLIFFIIAGYELDIIKYGINRDPNAPGFDIVRQFINGVKSFAVGIVYYIIPVIIGAILAVIFQHWLSGLISFIIAIVFSLAAIMAQCRLAKTEDVFDALSVGQAIGDISRVGIVKLILLIVIIVVILVVLYVIAGVIMRWNTTVGGIILGILGVYTVFFISRATGLLYSDV
ncbi:MAG: DUF4013 domain-containing protein [Methanobrevibacter sp.]|nr:DUF4013 domain-containing protein [Methanobrevibacter sp.]